MATKAAKSATQAARLKILHKEEVAPALVKQFKLNASQAPGLEKIVVSVGLGKDKENKRMFEIASNTLTKVTGQKPIETYAKQSIASFKLREGQRIGLKVTLRGDMMYEFYDRLVNLVIPRLRDFHGVSDKSFDGQGNYSLGIKEQSIFHELSFEEVSTPHGMEITIVTTTADDEQSQALLAGLGMPFVKRESK